VASAAVPYGEDGAAVSAVVQVAVLVAGLVVAAAVVFALAVVSDEHQPYQNM